MSNPTETGGVGVSVVIPVYNEEESLYELRDELVPVLEGLREPFEIVYVDDGSRDRTPEILREFHEADPRVRVIRFVRNFGQQMACTVGLRHTRGRAVIVMDADLQTPAKHIPELLAKLREGYDIVYGQRERIRGPFYRRLGTMAANFLLNKATGTEIPDGASSFLALDARLVQNVNRFNEKTRYLSALFARLSYGRYAVVPVTRRPRAYGSSKYKLGQLVGIVLNLLINSSTRPLYLAFWAGLAFMGAAGLLFIRWVAALAEGGWANGEPALFTAVVVLAISIQLLAIAILGAYVGRIYSEVRDNPPYLIAEILESKDKTAS